MKVLIVGASGMLGHQLWLELSKTHDVYGTVRRRHTRLQNLSNSSRHIIPDVNAYDLDKLKSIIDEHDFDVIINCIGIVKQLDESKNYISSISINSLFPHQLAKMAAGSKLIQISTDCVFSGSRGDYSEDDLPDASDLYGRSKLLGEINYGHHLTIRTSIVGHELDSNRSLLDWFLSSSGSVFGYSRAIYSGLTTLELARQINWILTNHFELSGLWQIASNPIDKFTLLSIVADSYEMEVDLQKNIEFITDKSLNFDKIKGIGYEPKDWPEMISDLRKHYLLYENSLYGTT